MVKMKISEHFFLLKRRIFKKNNIIFIVVMMILLLAMFASLTVMSLFVTNELSSLNRKLSSREIYVYPPLKKEVLTIEDLDIIKNIDHIDYVGGKIFSGSIELYIDELNKPFSEASINVTPLLDSVEPKMVKGSGNIYNGEMICPVNFYPYEVYYFDDKKDEDSEETDEVFEMKKKIIKSALLNSKDLIGKTITVKYSNYDYRIDYETYKEEYNTKDFKIVGAYKENYTMDSFNTCYVTKEDFFEMASFQNQKKKDQEINKEYSGIMVLIDDYKNMSSVHQELNKLNYVYEDHQEVDKADKLFFTYAPMFITIIIVLIAINIIYNFNSKKIKGRVSNYALLKSIGYDNKTITINEILENVICYLISFILSLIIFIICFIYIKTNFIASYVVLGYLINIPILAIISIFIIVLCLLIIINNKLVAKKIKRSVLELMRNEI